MSSTNDTLQRLRAELEAEPGSFLLQLRVELEWDPQRFSRLVEVMHEYLSTTTRGDSIERWIAEGFWYLDHFVRDWSQHPSFPRSPGSEYYEAAYERLHDLAYWLFCESPYLDGSGFEVIEP